MPKGKTHKGLKKRVHITAKGKVVFKHPGSGHLMSCKSGDRCRRLRQPAVLTGGMAKMVKTALSN